MIEELEHPNSNDNESSVVVQRSGFDDLPTEIYHQVAAFLFDNSFSSLPAESSLSAVYFYFYLLSLLNSHMYFRVHSSEFWQYDKIQIVLRNKAMFNRSVLMQQEAETTTSQEQDTSTSDKKYDDEEEEAEETVDTLLGETLETDSDQSLSHVQFKYLYELIKVCQFRSIQFVGMSSLENTTFIHDLLKKLCACDPEILQNLQSLSIHCTIVDLEILKGVLQSCEQLKELRLFSVVHRDLSCTYITSYEQLLFDAKTKQNDTLAEYSCLETIEYHHWRKGHHHQTSLYCRFLERLCRKSPNLRSLSVESLPATEELFLVLGKHCKELESVRFVTTIVPMGSQDNSSVDDSIVEMVNGCSKISTLILEHDMIPTNLHQHVSHITDALRDSLRCLNIKVGLYTVPSTAASTSSTTPSVLEEIILTREHSSYNQIPLIGIGDVCGNSRVKSLQAKNCDLAVRDYELHLLSHIQSLSFRELRAGLTVSQVVDACRNLKQLTIQRAIETIDLSNILTFCHGLTELSINCNSSTIPTVLQHQPEKLKKLSVTGGGNMWGHVPSNPTTTEHTSYGHMNLEDFTYNRYEQHHLNTMLEHCPKLRSLTCMTQSSSLDLILRCCPNIKSVSIPHTPTIFPRRMNQLRSLAFIRYFYHRSVSIEQNAIETMTALIHCPSIVSLKLLDFWHRIDSLVDCFALDIERSHGEDAPVGVACRFIIEMLAKSAFEKSEGLTLAEKEEVRLSIEHCLAKYCDDNCTDDILFKTTISDCGMELHLRRLIALIRTHYVKRQEDVGQLEFLLDM